MLYKHLVVKLLSGAIQILLLNLLITADRYGKATATAYVQGILTSEPHDISLLFFLWYLHSGGGTLLFRLSYGLDYLSLYSHVSIDFKLALCWGYLLILPQFCNFEAVTANLSLPIFFLSEIGEENTVGIQNKSVIARNIIARKKDHCYKLLKYFFFYFCS